MKRIFFLVFAFALVSCSKISKNSEVIVTNFSELKISIENARPGDIITMANGVWKDIQIIFNAEGTEQAPIILKAESPGKVFIEGVSNLKFGGKYLVVDGLHFRNGFSPDKAVVDFRVNDSIIANHCIFTNSVIKAFNKMQRDDADHWIQFWGRHNTLSNCYISGKTNRGPTIRVFLKGNEHIYNEHKILNNHFGPRPPKGGASAETIQIGDSSSSMSPSSTLVAKNLFEECNGEVEIISSKTNFNEFRNNVFYKSEGSLVTRHGNYSVIDSNYFIGDGKNENIGGIRIINTGHKVTNNYFYNLKGKNFRSPLAVMNGIPKSPLNRYGQVTDLVLAYNTYINCESPWQFGVGVNINQKEVLPLSEIRSARPKRCIVANNLVFNEIGNKSIVVEHDKVDGVIFKNNVVNKRGVDFKDYAGIKLLDFQLKQVTEHIYLPSSSIEIEPFIGFEFENITKDLFGNSRTSTNGIGAVVNQNANAPDILDKSNYGPSWYSDEAKLRESKTINVTTNENLQNKIDEAKNGDILVLEGGLFSIKTSLSISKTIYIKSKEGEKAILNYSGEKNTPMFQLNPNGVLSLDGVVLKGSGSQYAFSSLKENMYSHFELKVFNCEISDFYYALKVYKQSFAERISFENTSILNCENGLELSEETNDKGDYNTEYLTVKNCYFNNVEQNVIDYYRGGYDESTVGGNLVLTNSEFTNCGVKEKNGILINTRGIINVNISDNIFKNNPVKLVALLWGAKNNFHRNNEISNSGDIVVEQNLKLKVIY
ncbi:alginate lyase [Hyunsoonleella flava]|uniref:Alginate lyase n=1 Tax=Hyunsoonleella flava TaxID=2527939 RepID=A0A4Q9FDK7_9FLAO|nr:chondroitinase-B domain-containing protein [Hyunsoonleella flava]TBN03659.1 alginate lyase [Hyunsoonleella flava]